jgi:competence protein ComEC
VLVVTAGIVVWVAARRGGAPARVGVATAALGLVLLAPVPRPDPVTLTVTVIDVGQGDAILVQGGGARILVDGGPDPTEVADWLQRRGIRHLDLVVQTHPHLDHTAGLPAVVQRLRVEAVWLRHVPTSTPYEQDLRDAAAERGVTVVEPVAGQAARVGGLVVHVLSPPPGLPFAGSESEVNEMSLVLRVDQGQRRALLPGDAERDAQWRMLAAPDSLRAGALAVPITAVRRPWTSSSWRSPPRSARSARGGTIGTGIHTRRRWLHWRCSRDRGPTNGSGGHDPGDGAGGGGEGAGSRLGPCTRST